MIYGVNPNEAVTPIMVRDAIVMCFTEAHCLNEELGGLPADKAVSDMYCKEIVRKMFKDTGGDFESPTKDSVVSVVSKLAEFSSAFRDKSVIEKHKQEIMLLVQKL